MRKKRDIFVAITGIMMLTACATLPPFQSAVGRGDTEAVRRYLAGGADINQKEELPLVLAAAFNKSQMVKFLIENGADPNGEAADGDTPLFTAVYYKRVDIVQMLVNAGADPHKYSPYGLSTPYELAQKKNDTQILRIFNEAEKKKLAAKEAREKVATGRTPVGDEKSVSGSTGIPIKSDIDDFPLSRAKPNKNAFAIVIGIEGYRQRLPRADFAAGDAKLMREYLTRALGYPEENVITLMNEQATKSDFEKYIEEWLPKNFEKNGSLFLYYSGHGAPNPRTGDAFLVPYDGDPNFIEKTGYPLKRLYEHLAKLPAKEVIVVLDSCFSGAGGRSVLAEGSRPLVMNMPPTLASAKNMIIMAASSGSEISSSYRDKGHGLFTYFLLKGIKGEADANEDGRIDMEELYQYLKPQVQKIARRLYNNEQTPQLIAPESAMKGIVLQK
jgi:hypothetical protein